MLTWRGHSAMGWTTSVAAAMSVQREAGAVAMVAWHTVAGIYSKGRVSGGRGVFLVPCRHARYWDASKLEPWLDPRKLAEP